VNKGFLFLTLNTFSATGGIEKVCRIAGKALSEIVAENGGTFSVYSMYDEGRHVDEAYFPASQFKGFSGNQVSFVLRSILEGRKSAVVLLSHINLLPIGYLIKKASPKTKLVLIAHGIEVWEEVGKKKTALRSVDLFLPVSSFTAAKLQTKYKIGAGKIGVLNNCLDPFLKKEANPALENNLRKRYGFQSDDLVLLTVTRLKYSEQYKGYDKVVEALQVLKTSQPNIKYLIVGKYDAEEKQRLDTIIRRNGLSDRVVFAGFVNDEELNAHFNIADVYIMPSSGEGFGIVFIEALYYGLPVIAGNADGSVDALAGGEFGLLVNPHSIEEIAAAIKSVSHNRNSFLPETARVLKRFGYDQYKQKLTRLLFQKAVAASTPAEAELS